MFCASRRRLLRALPVDGEFERRVGALAHGWLGDRVTVQVPSRWLIWLTAADVERERFDD